MSRRAIIALKVLVHLLCLAPFAWLVRFYTSGALALNPDPVNYITHFTGNWTLYILLACLAVTPIRRLSPKIVWLVRFRRLVGLYAFFYASLHLATYVFLFSGYDITAAIASLRVGHPGGIIAQWEIIWPGILDDLAKRRFIQVGLLAWFILFLLAVTSPAFIMRRMGGKRWRWLHSLIYVAAIAGVIHFWWLVKPGVLSPWKDTAALTVLLLARIGYSVIKKHRKPKPAPAAVAH